jgi:spore germination protein GerM
VAPAVLALVLLGAWAAWSARESRPTRAPESALQGEPEAVIEPFLPPGAVQGGEAIDFPRQAVTLYWPRADGSGLEAVEAEIFATQRVTDRAKQVVELLLRGPTVEAADEDPGEEPEAGAEGPEFIPPLPSGTSLRAAFVGDDGTAYVSLSSELTKGPAGGSRRELAAVYSVVNSLVQSLPEIERVQFLVEGREIESVGGHLDARFPFAFSERVLALPPQEG